MIKHALLVCKSCSFSPTQRDYMGKSGGFHLLNQLLNLSQKWALQSEFVIQEVNCLSACKRLCAVAFTVLNKTTLIFGDLPPLKSAAAVIELGEQYYSSNNGIVPRQKRPEILKKGILSQIPPLPES